MCSLEFYAGSWGTAWDNGYVDDILILNGGLPLKIDGVMWVFAQG